MPRLAGMEYCTGCGACADRCPKGCIFMEADADGFWYPAVDSARCVECGLCETACPVLGQPRQIREPAAYAAHNRDAGTVGRSSSGGVFTALAEAVIRQGGAVYGAAFREDLTVAHRRADNVEELAAFRGSKYLQSDVGHTYRQVERDLKAGRKVLFSGTPCQVAALRQYLGRDWDALLCVDIICHSVPSAKVWQAYLRSVEKAAQGKVTGANFRDKRDGWQGYYLCTRLDSGREVLKTGNENVYMRAFIGGLSTRPSCYNCKFKGSSRASDLTLGDFWGVETACPQSYHPEGTSLVLVNSDKGQAAFEAITGELATRPVELSAALGGNPAYSEASKPHPRREEFFARLEQEEFGELTQRLLAPTRSELRQQRWNRSILVRGVRKVCRMFLK